MPRVDTNRSLPLTYRAGPPPEPGSTPEQIVRAVWEELTRITTSLSDYDRPVSMSLDGPDTIVVGPTATFNRMFDAAPTIIWLKPGGTLAVNGMWTASQEGLYLINGALVSQPFAAPATRSYQVLANVTKRPANGSPDVIYQFGGGGVDDNLVTAPWSLLLPLLKGDRIFVNGAGIHPNKSGTNTVQARMNITRQSGLGNNAD